MELKIEYLPVGKLKPYEKNTRKHQEKDITEIEKSITKYGFDDPIGIWGEQNIIVEGHGRLIAAKRLGMAEVPVIRLDHLTDEQRREYAIMHNRTAELSEWDFEMLEQEMTDLDLEDFDFDDLEIHASDFDETAELEEVDAPEPPEEPKSKAGEIYQLGEHRLMCGDSTKAEDVARLMAGETADILITDPPYNVDYEGKTEEKLKIESDKMDGDSFVRFLTDAFTNAERCLKPGGGFYVWTAQGHNQLQFATALDNAGLQFRQQLIWNKNTIVMGHMDYQWKHEPCFYGWKDGAAHYFVKDRTLPTVIPDLGEIDPDKMKKEELAQLVKKILQAKVATTIIDEKKPARNAIHPTMKPINLIGEQMRNSSRRGEIVLDIFGGSGTTLMAAEQLNRKCRMMEFDPRYMDAIIERWETFTGRKAVKIDK